MRTRKSVVVIGIALALVVFGLFLGSKGKMSEAQAAPPCAMFDMVVSSHCSCSLSSGTNTFHTVTGTNGYQQDSMITYTETSFGGCAPYQGDVMVTLRSWKYAQPYGPYYINHQVDVALPSNGHSGSAIIGWSVDPECLDPQPTVWLFNANLCPQQQ